MRKPGHGKKEEFRLDILSAARELFSCDGYENFSMRKLARRIGYSPTTIYLYFRDKDDLLFCLCEELFTEMGSAIGRLREEGARPFISCEGSFLPMLNTALRIRSSTGSLFSPARWCTALPRTTWTGIP